MSDQNRAVSPVISTILMVAVVVVLAATISVLVLGFGEETTETGPVVGQSTGEFIADRSGSDDQIVRITHVAGDDINVSNLEIAVEACGRSARIINLPSDANNFGFEGFDDENFERGDRSFIAKGTFGSEWDAGVLHESNPNSFTAGSSFEFRIKNTGTGCRIQPRDTVTVRVIHTPTDSVVITKELEAE